MKKFLFIFITVVFSFAIIINTCNEDDNYEYLDAESEEFISSSVEMSPSNNEDFNEQENTDSQPVLGNDENVDSEAIEIPRLTQALPEQILHRIGYTLSYNNSTKNANWVSWHLTKEHTDGPWSRDGIPYSVDNDVKGARQELDDWENHNLPIDHGHLCPAGDNKWNKQALEETLLLTNMCPQYSSLNQGDWKYLEERSRGWARNYGDVYIVCGPIFYSSNYRTIGANKVGVPDAFYKVVLCLTKKPKGLGFIYPNNAEHHKIQHYVRTIDEVEEVTGIDFFFNLPDDIEDSVESHSDISRW